jgi:hypothetical protein
MKLNCYNGFLAGVMLLVLSGQVLARRVNHDVIPANVGKLPFSATVNIKDAGNLKEFEITLSGVQGNLFRPSSPGGWLTIVNEDRPGAAPAVTKVDKGGAITFTFQLTAEQVARARFGFVEDVEDWNRPFPARGDYYQFMLKEFKGNSGK